MHVQEQSLISDPAFDSRANKGELSTPAGDTGWFGRGPRGHSKFAAQVQHATDEVRAILCQTEPQAIQRHNRIKGQLSRCVYDATAATIEPADVDLGGG